MQKILLTNTNYQDRVKSISLMSIVPPLDIAYCAAVLRQIENVDTKLIDANVLNLNNIKLLNYINKENPDIVVFTAETYSINSVKKIVKNLKKQKIILIGTHGTVLAEQTLVEIPELDYIIIGESEHALKELVEKITKHKSVDGIKGIAYKKGGKIIVNKPRAFIQDLDSLPFPARDLLPNELYSSPYSNNVTAIRTTRGCPGHCSYCEAHNMYGYITRLRSPERIIEEIKHCITKYRTEYFAILDHTFTADKKFVSRFCNLIIKQNLNNKIIWSCNARVDTLTQETIKLMKKAGCLQIGIGIETDEDERLFKIKKSFKQEKIKKIVKNIKKQGIICMGYAIIGFPGETLEDIKKIENMLFEYNPHIIQLSFATPLPGSELYDYCLKNKLFLSFDWDDFIFLNKYIIKNPNFSHQEIINIRNNIVKKFYFRPTKIIKLTSIFLLRRKVRYKMCVAAFLKILRKIT